MRECDVVIPVYKSPEWVELCLYALFQNTKEATLNKVFLINDSDDAFTKNCLKNLKDKYGKKVIIKQNKKNIGFTGTANIGLRLSSAKYVLLLNTDCLISKNTIEKLISYMQKDEKIGLICPISSNAANLSLDILEGFTYMQMNELLEKRFSGMLFDACTVVGNCLMISRKCVDEVGVLDEIYAPGYGEETDYQFAAMEKGFSAKIAADTYVFHKAETSFGVSEKKQKMIDEHLEIFLSRWGDKYRKELEKYNGNDPVKYILDDFENNPPKIKNSAMFYMMNIGMSGGCNVVVDIINRLTINGYHCNILYDSISEYPESMLFKPVSTKCIDEVSTEKIVATLWITAFLVNEIAKKKKWETLYFIQGLEQHFDNGKNYGAVETSYKIPQRIIAVSKPLRDWLRDIYGVNALLIKNGINLELIRKKRKERKLRTILLIARGSYSKCDCIVFDVLRRIDNTLNDVKVNIVVLDKEYILPLLHNRKNKYNVIKGVQPRTKIYELMQDSDIYVDTSYSEGFGLTALEAMAAGCIPIVSDSFGVRDYILDSKNGFIVEEINDARAYLKAIEKIMNSEELCKNIITGMTEVVRKYDFNDRIKNYKAVFCEKQKNLGDYQVSLSLEEEKISERIVSDYNKAEREWLRIKMEEQERQRREKEWRENLTVPQRIYLKIRYILIGR